MKWTCAALTIGCCLLIATLAPAEDLARLFTLEEALDSPDSRAVRTPTGLAAATSTELAVVDAHGNRLVVFGFTGSEWTVTQTVQLPGTPRDIAHDGNRYLISLREGHGLMAVEGARHQLRPVAMPQQAVAGALAAVPGGGFLVHNATTREVLELDVEGTVESATSVEAGITGLAADSSGGFFVTRPASGEILHYDPTGRISERWEVPGAGPVPAWPVDLVTMEGDLLVLDRHGHRMVLFDSLNRPEGTGARRGWEPGLLLFPSALAALPDGRIAVADQMNGRVQLYRRAEE